MRTASMGRRSALAAERAIEMAANRTSTSLPLVVLVGDSRMDSVVRAIKPKGSIAFAESVTLGDFGEASVLFLTSDTLPSLQFLNPFTDSIMALAPRLIAVQAEMLVPNSARIKRIGDHRPIAQGGLGQRGGTLAQWRAQEPPEAGLDFTVGERWAAAAAAASIPMLYLEIPLSVSVMAVVPDGYFEARRALLTPLGGAFVRLGEPLADDHFRDLRHVNRVGRDAVQILLVTELARHL
ncbi:MAG: hypothetical protein JKY37_17515 [Nannocystaceae bacterium]|nr:hypothetical protein [Nannocystaceae bacterium]